MKPGAAYRTDLPPDEPEWERSSTVSQAVPQPHASDNATEEKVVLYGPRGAALIREVPRHVGFRPPR